MSPYPRHTLLELRERAEEEAELALAQALRVLTEAEARRCALEAELARRRDGREAQVLAHLAQVLASGAEARALALMGTHVERLKDAESALEGTLRQQEGAVTAAQEALAQARARLAEAARELKVLQKHREAWAQARRAAREGREEQAQEEVASALFLSRQRK